LPNKDIYFKGKREPYNLMIAEISDPEKLKKHLDAKKDQTNLIEKMYALFSFDNGYGVRLDY
jgi:hypothetical protein